jgi:hypothetical protein
MNNFGDGIRKKKAEARHRRTLWNRAPAVKADPTSLLGRDLFVREARHVGALAGVLNSNPADVAVLVEIQKS